MFPKILKYVLLIYVCIILNSSKSVLGLSDLQRFEEEAVKDIYCHHDDTSEKGMFDELALRTYEKVNRDLDSLKELCHLIENLLDSNVRLVRTRRSFKPSESKGLVDLLSDSHTNLVIKKRVDLRTLMSQDSFKKDSLEESIQQRKRLHIELPKIAQPKPQYNKINQEVLSKLNSIGKLEISLERVYDVLGRLHQHYDQYGYLISKLSWLAGRSFPSWLKLTFQTLHTLTKPALSKRSRKKGILVGSAPKSSNVDKSISSDSTYKPTTLQDTLDVDEITTEIGRQAIIFTVGLVTDMIFKSDEDASLSSKILNDVAKSVSCYLVIQFATVERLGGQCKRN